MQWGLYVCWLAADASVSPFSLRMMHVCSLTLCIVVSCVHFLSMLTIDIGIILSRWLCCVDGYIVWTIGPHLTPKRARVVRWP